ncbi:hypothetical protein L873DRAFT_1791508 [Choiromyces venosus 120613-1]|uniref:Uncharacterized protein n=1 Tax=Choiromyces venosus 120613-1 TaxID=1336337 RepID=A0A3N4JEN6_9PEZI|nr:hypothetical protein L873DRAFT_1791508 [Choiromyces venosus 120613-1]
MPRKPPATSSTTSTPRLIQTRLAGPNHHSSKSVRSSTAKKSPAPQQSALSSFGFRKEATPSTAGSSSGGKKRVYASDDEIAETQFGFATQSFCDDLGPSPETPKRVRRGEVPSSHSPPGSPWTPKGKEGSGGIPFRIGGGGDGEEVERVIESSQWWENEELSISTQRSGEEEETTIRGSLSLSLSPSASPASPLREIKQGESPSPPSPPIPQVHSQVDVVTTTTQIPINFRDTPIPPPPPPSVPPPTTIAADEPEPEESQEPQLPFHHHHHHHDDDEGEILPPSPTQSMGVDEFERDDEDDVDEDGLHAFNPVRTQQLPSSFYIHDGRESSPPMLPTVLTEGFSSQGLPVEEEGEAAVEELEQEQEVVGEGVEEAVVEAEEEVERDGKGRRNKRPITVSQLLPSSLMETFPLPPPLSQFSSYGGEFVPGSETQ